MINGSSNWNGGTLLRTELIANFNEPLLQTGTVYYKWSMMMGSTDTLHSLYEHQLVFFEAHFADIKFGGPAGTNLQWFPNGQPSWSTPFTSGVWYNFALQVDYTNSMVSLWTSTGATAMTLVAGPIAASVTKSDFHVGNLRVQDSNGQQDPAPELIYYSSCQLVSSPNDFAFLTTPPTLPTSPNYYPTYTPPPISPGSPPNTPGSPPNTPGGNLQGNSQAVATNNLSGGAIAGIVIVVLFAVGVIVGAAIYIKFYKNKQIPTTYQYQTSERQEPPLQYVSTPTPTNNKSLPPLPPPPTKNLVTNFTVGSQVMATYSGDGLKYKAVITDTKGQYYLVRYVDFGNDMEWLPFSSIS